MTQKWCLLYSLAFLFYSGISFLLGTVGFNPSAILDHRLWFPWVRFGLKITFPHIHIKTLQTHTSHHNVFADTQSFVSASTSRWSQRSRHCTFQNNLSGCGCRHSLATSSPWRTLESSSVFVDWKLHALVWIHLDKPPNSTPHRFSVVGNMNLSPLSAG